MIFQNSKKGFLFLNFFVWITIFFLIFFLLILTNNQVKLSKEKINKIAPEISYQFPSAYLVGFLYFPLNESEKKRLGVDKDVDFYVKDYISLQSFSESDDLFKNIKKRYNIIFNLDSFSKFNRFSGVMLASDKVRVYEFDNPDFYYECAFFKGNFGVLVPVDESYSKVRLVVFDGSSCDRYFGPVSSSFGISYSSSSESNIGHGSGFMGGSKF